MNSTDAAGNTHKATAQNGLYIGMMSGTSLDGLDAVLCQFAPHFKLIATHTLDFSESLKATLLALCQPSTQLTDGYSELDHFGKASVDYAKLATQCVHELLAKADFTTNNTRGNIVAIGCHGQTVRHRPELGFSLQLVDANYIAERTGISVISDFRRRDMAVGGQGAPLVPAFHADMFLSDSTHRVLLNLGGIANITLLPAGKPAQATGYDTGPANLLLDAWCLKHTGKAYDEGGNWASTGNVNTQLLAKLLEHTFFAKAVPKSTGREDFHIDWLESQLDGFVDTTPTDIQTTLVELTAKSAADAIVKSCSEIFPSPALGKAETTKSGEVFVCGGGAYNDYLLQRLAAHLPNWQVMTTKEIGLAPTWVEATAFAWLARQHELGLAANLPSVTGASKAVVLGVKAAS